MLARTTAKHALRPQTSCRCQPVGATWTNKMMTTKKTVKMAEELQSSTIRTFAVPQDAMRRPQSMILVCEAYGHKSSKLPAGTRRASLFQLLALLLSRARTLAPIIIVNMTKMRAYMSHRRCMRILRDEVTCSCHVLQFSQQRLSRETTLPRPTLTHMALQIHTGQQACPLVCTGSCPCCPALTRLVLQINFSRNFIAQ